jgi:hypothetical protein
MIVFDLHCSNNHEFESWFANSEAFEKLKKVGEVACPVCGDAKVEKALMAPALSGAKKRSSDKAASDKAMVHAGEYMTAIRELREKVEQNCDYVGEKFPEEARKIHYGEAKERNIYGEASIDDAKALADEGVEVQAIPWAPKADA